jgi:hypothetical protein
MYLVMFSYLSLNVVFSMMEYFSYLNLWLVVLFLFIVMFILLIGGSQLFLSSKVCSDAVFELSLTIFCLILVGIVISPALIIMLDCESIMMPSFVMFCDGMQ